MNDTGASEVGPTDAEQWHDELVAYLDGEVTASERVSIEERLTEDEDYRAALVELERNWRLLDRLPTAGEDKDFTKSTIALVTEEIRNPSASHSLFDLDSPTSELTQTGKSARTSTASTIPWGKILAALVAGMIGFFAIFLPGRGADQREVKDMPLAANMQLFRYAESVEFLEMLRDTGLFASDTETTAALWNESNDARVIRDGIRRLTAEEKQVLLTQLERMHKLDFAEKGRLHEMQRDIVAKPDSAKLFRVLKGYRKWLMTLTAWERASLQDIPDAKERIVEMTKLHKEKAATWTNPDGSKFAVTKDELEQYFESLSPEERDDLKQMPPNEMRERLKRWFLQDNAGTLTGDAATP